ncbi:hypothetical protein EJ08DRAFT_738481 [Tothia fuscella]|uniref:Poly(A) RNA polymerase mitochondrial-like central palm domain-containing protein n=1 Tax=Tothia fuscella TaxID=1048955 RepID=A0A9P4NH26_9PEZI|nr:hypothetical protein EJ08DRAFT_738481 [Tothia fuscella]
MPIVRSRARCRAPNAFRFRTAIWSLFPEQQLPPSSTSTRTYQRPSKGKLRTQDENQEPGDENETKEHKYAGVAEGISQGPRPKQHFNLTPRKPASDLLRDKIVSSSLAESLERLRDANRAAIVNKVELKGKFRRDAQTKQLRLPQENRDRVEEGQDKSEELWRFRKDIQNAGLVALGQDTPHSEGGKNIWPKNLWPKTRALRIQTHTPEQVVAPREELTADASVREIFANVPGIWPQDKSHDPDRPELEYEGRYVLPMAHKYGKIKIEDHAELPWMEGMKEISKASHQERLTHEIKMFAEWIRPTLNELRARDAAAKQTRDIIHNILPNLSTELFGSQKTGLALATSDIDIRLFEDRPEVFHPEAAPRKQTRLRLHHQLQKLHDYFLDHKDYILVQLRHARYPLITMQHKESSYDIQIVCNNDTSLSQDTIRRNLEADPDLFPLFALVKVAFDIRGLSDVFRGGLGSYSLFMMLVASSKIDVPTLKSWQKALAAGTCYEKLLDIATARLPVGLLADSDIDLGVKFVEFLKFYESTTLNTYATGISVEEPFLFPKEDKDVALKRKGRYLTKGDLRTAARHHISAINPDQPYLLTLQDPAEPNNDLGRKGYGIKHIQATLTHLLEGLRKANGDAPGAKKVAPRGPLVSRLAPFVGSCYEGFKGRRDIAEEFGKGIRERMEDAAGEGEGEDLVKGAMEKRVGIPRPEWLKRAGSRSVVLKRSDADTRIRAPQAQVEEPESMEPEPFLEPTSSQPENADPLIPEKMVENKHKQLFRQYKRRVEAAEEVAGESAQAVDTDQAKPELDGSRGDVRTADKKEEGHRPVNTSADRDSEEASRIAVDADHAILELGVPGGAHTPNEEETRNNTPANSEGVPPTGKPKLPQRYGPSRKSREQLRGSRKVLMRNWPPKTSQPQERRGGDNTGRGGGIGKEPGSVFRAVLPRRRRGL